MSYCQNCGAELSPDDAYCTNCGAAVQGAQGGGTQSHQQGQPAQQPQGGQPTQQPQGGQPGQQPQGGQPGQQPQGGQPGQRPRGGQPAPQHAGGAETGRRDLLKYGAVGGLALAGIGGAWFVMGDGSGGASGPTVLNDFENGVGDEWNGDVGAFETVPDSMAGDQSAELAFASGTEVWREIPETTASEFSFWWQTSAVRDNEFTVWFHDLGIDEEPTMENAQFGFEVGAENSPQVVTAPPFQNQPGYAVLTDQPRPDTWYKTRITNIDYEANTFDVELLDSEEEVIGQARGESSAGTADSVNAIYVRNHMNFTGASARIDHIVQRK